MQTGHRMRPATRRIALSSLLAGALMVGIPLSPASAADITPRVAKTVSATAGTYNEFQQVRVTINWSVQNAAVGDTFTAPLARQLDPRKFVPMELKNAAGNVVATVAIKRDAGGNYVRDAAGNSILEFTFTDFVATHVNLSGEAWFEIGFDSSVITFPPGTNSITTTIHGSQVTITRSAGPVGNEFLKYGNWRSPNNSEAEATALNPDGTSANPGADILWAIQLQGGAQSRAPGWTRATIVDNAGAGQHFECPLSPAVSFIVRDAAGEWVRTSVPTASVTACSASQVTIVVTKAATDDNVYRVRIPGWISGGPLPNAYGNSASVAYETPNGPVLSHNVSGSLARAASGGNGTGVIVLGPNPPKLTITKVALAKQVRAGKTVRWRIVVRNTGTGTARNVRICDVLRDQQSFASTRATLVISAKSTRTLVVANGAGCITVPSLTPGKRAIVIVKTQVPTTARTRVRNTGTATATGLGTVRAVASVRVLRVAGRVIIPSPVG